MAAAGVSAKGIAEALHTERRVTTHWRARFLEAGVDGLLKDAARLGRPRTVREPADVEEVVRATLNQTPEGATDWSTRSLALNKSTSN